MSLASRIANFFNLTPSQQQQQLAPSHGREPQASLTYSQYGEDTSSDTRPTETKVQTMEEEDEIRVPYLRVRLLPWDGTHTVGDMLTCS